MLHELANWGSNLTSDTLEVMLILLQHGASTKSISRHCKNYEDFCLVRRLQTELKANRSATVTHPAGNAPDSLGEQILHISYNGATPTILTGKNKGEIIRYPGTYITKDELLTKVSTEPLKSIRQYTRTGANTAVVKKICLNVENDAFLRLIARYADKLTVEQIARSAGDKSPFIARDIKLTFDSPTTAKGEYVYESSWETEHYENLKITLQPAGFGLPDEW